ncbi:hypothetical protein MuYL_1919 [Mucilaginibacter xinganensis]|uniref:Uncharacterized protein n=1 Tax=Mucilaginibacter xinganensis TaxID=1234841 RepID=A0A223NVB1_9SPHI|nr:hypothetical protein MuYL_1919 [Mucilaginibacter xinganensis]
MSNTYSLLFYFLFGKFTFSQKYNIFYSIINIFLHLIAVGG